MGSTEDDGFRAVALRSRCDFRGFKSRLGDDLRRSQCCSRRRIVDSPGLSKPKGLRCSASTRLNERSDVKKWTRRDLNPGPLPCEGSDLPLIYEPSDNPTAGFYLYLVFRLQIVRRAHGEVQARSPPPVTTWQQTVGGSRFVCPAWGVSDCFPVVDGYRHPSRSPHSSPIGSRFARSSVGPFPLCPPAHAAGRPAPARAPT